MLSDMSFLFPALRDADFTSTQLFGIRGINRRDDPCSPTGFNPRVGRSITTVENLSETLFDLIHPTLVNIQGSGWGQATPVASTTADEWSPSRPIGRMACRYSSGAEERRN